jgi:hypothetical protein
MGTIDIKRDTISLSKMRNAALLYGTICCGLYISFLFLMKMMGLIMVTELRFVNYLILCLVGMYQISHWIKQTGAPVPFLQVLISVLCTGVWSFMLFSLFLYIYNRYDLEFAELFVKETRGVFPAMPSIVILFEGSAMSIIAAFINMQYFRRYEEGEKAPMD